MSSGFYNKVSFTVQALAVAHAAVQDILIHKTLDYRIIVSLAHVVRAVVVKTAWFPAIIY